MAADMLALLREYIQLRELGKTQGDVIQHMRARIALLSTDAQRELANEIRIFEGAPPQPISAMPSRDTDTKPPPRLKALAPQPTAVPQSPNELQAYVDAMARQDAHEAARGVGKPPTPPLPAGPRTVKPLASAGARKTPCPRCTHQNLESAAFCGRCGYFLQMDTQAFQTIQLSEASTPNPNEYFDARATLVFLVREDAAAGILEKQFFNIRPQDQTEPIIIGRSDLEQRPDIDLGALNAGKLGVSRQHVAITYSAADRTLTVRDLKSANGTFINGQRLNASEARLLRQSDELRLGRLPMLVIFHTG